MKKTTLKKEKTLLGKIQPSPVLTKKEQRRLDKKMVRYLAFLNYFQPPLYVRPGFIRELLRGIIVDKEKDDKFIIHHKINFGGVVKAVLGLRAYNKEISEMAFGKEVE